MAPPRGRSRIAVGVVGLAAVVLLVVAAVSAATTDGPAVLDVEGAASPSARPSASPSASPSSSSTPSGGPTDGATTEPATPAPPPGPPGVLPDGGQRIFEDGRFLVAYYGTAGTGSLGVLGERGPDASDQRLRAAARPFARPGHPVQRVYELIVTVADRSPGEDGDYSHDIPRAAVRDFIDAAHRNGALVLLDLQPGRTDFLTVAKRWEWALRDPWVGLALDPEWRMGPRQVPGRVLGGVDAREVNQTSAWLAELRRSNDLPEKLFVLHQFRSSMIRRIDAVQPRGGLAVVQHVDGFGTRGQKLSTYAAIARPDKFTMGFKLFYDEDVDRMGPAQVHAIRPRVRFISFQ